MRQEQSIYASVRGAFLPRCLAWDDDGRSPLLVLEDLSHGFWPPPWSSARVDAVLAALDLIHGTAAPARTWEKARFATMGCWQAVASDPDPFLALGLVSRAWLEGALPSLRAAEARVETEGSCLIHFDVRSDNICLVEGRALLVDWNCACLGNPELDLGFWLPSLAAEGGPEPESLLPDAGHVASWVSGFFAARAGQPLIPHAPRVREVQRLQLDTALPWAVRSLDLPPPDGPR